MSDVSQPTVTDPAGIPRTPDGTIADPNATKTPETPPSNEKIEPPKVEPKADDKTSLLSPDGTKKEEPTKTEAKPGVPEKYEFKAPEGQELKPEVVESASVLFKELGMTQEGAQKLFDFHTKLVQEAASAPAKAYQDLRADWVKQAKALPGIGTELESGGKVVVTIGKALDQLGDPKLASDFRAAMNLTGAGDNPAFIRVVYAWAQQLTEGSHVAGNGPSKVGQQAPGQTGRKTAAQEMYPTLPSGSGA